MVAANAPQRLVTLVELILQRPKSARNVLQPLGLQDAAELTQQVWPFSNGRSPRPF